MMKDTECLSIGFGIGLVICGIIAAVLALTGCDEASHAETVPERFDHSDAWDEDGWTFATVTDTETGVVYLVFRDCGAKWAVGGITPLLKSDGSVTIDDSIGADGA